MRSERRAANVQKMKRTIRHVEVQVDELILQEPFAFNRYDIGDAFSHELGLLFREVDRSPSFIQGAQVPLLRAGQIAVLPGTKPALIGTQIAQAVYGSLDTLNKRGRL